MWPWKICIAKSLLLLGFIYILQFFVLQNVFFFLQYFSFAILYFCLQKAHLFFSILSFSFAKLYFLKKNIIILHVLPQSETRSLYIYIYIYIYILRVSLCGTVLTWGGVERRERVHMPGPGASITLTFYKK